MWKFALCILIALFASTEMIAQSPVGVWKTIDDNTGEAKSHIEIFEDRGELHGKIVALLTVAPDKLCEECEGDKENQPLMGMTIVESLSPYKDYWSKGKILDPENGNEYKCSIWFEEGQKDELRVRGKHWTGIYRTQTWYKVK